MENTYPGKCAGILITEEDEIGFLLPGNTGPQDDPYL
jgi:hypothetical protein